jgi:membrane protease YdiL (CAAX protease family)
MNISLFIVAIVWSVFGVALYYFLITRGYSGEFFLKKWRGFNKKVSEVIIQRLWGVLLFGLASLVILIWGFDQSPHDYGASFSFKEMPPWWSYPVIPIILIVGHFHASSLKNLEMYPQVRVEKWSIGILFLSAATWVAYLVGYEFLFRGFLFHATLQVWSLWPAIALNCILYALAHFYKGPGEIIGAIPVGILLCYITLHTGNIWSAVIIHSSMALSNEWFSLRSHPNMHL